MSKYLVRPGDKVDLDDLDPDDTSLFPGGKAAVQAQLAAVVERLAGIQELIFVGHERKVLIVLQGMDTGGKDGTIRHVMRGVNPQVNRLGGAATTPGSSRGPEQMREVPARRPGGTQVLEDCMLACEEALFTDPECDLSNVVVK